MQCAQKILHLPVTSLTAGCWFNEMRPGDVTLAHSHDQNDELLSGVYYIKVPEHSGDLILQTEPRIQMRGKTGQMIFFPPDLLHQVSANHSTEVRLSIGFNITNAKEHVATQ
jgi:quercetin dioxygenase-like cupin family protein